MPPHVAQGREEVGEGLLELFGEGGADDLAVGVQGGLPREKDDAAAGGGDGVGEAGGRGELGGVETAEGHLRGSFGLRLRVVCGP